MVSAGRHHSIVLMSDGRVFGTGKYNSGELGIGRLDALKYTEKNVNQFI